MIILQVHVDGIFAVPRKSHSPIPACVNGVSSPVPALQRVEAKSRYLHLIRRFGGIKGEQNAPNATRILHTELRGIAALGKAAQALAAERPNHSKIVRCCLTFVQYCLLLLKQLSLPPAGDVRTVAFASHHAFFEAELLVTDKGPDRAVVNLQTVFGQFAHQPQQGEVLSLIRPSSQVRCSPEIAQGL